MTSTDPWVSVHLFHQGEQDRLVLDLVAPVVTELREHGLTDRWFYLRYWNGGPHLRLRVLARTEEAREEIRSVLAARCTGHLARSPSPDLVDQQTYLEQARRFGALEGVEPVERMYANNSVHLLPYTREHDRYGRGDSLEAVERHFCESSDLALRILGSRPEPTQRETTVLTFLLLSWFTAAEDVGALARRQLDHAAERIRFHGPESAERSADALYESSRERLERIAATAGRVVRARDRLRPGSLTDWARSVGRMTDALRVSGPGDAPASTTGVADLCTHLFANRIGVRIDAEGSLRYLAARAVTETTMPEEA
ncbi:thiopeptide-type bacteriocin biosynthesis protein [Nocardiopsis xinjiangensis]|uniref:thiopeptide-type bacteriocin biosynthesis protein n=1 Tax=Nocardiopsis xinjiangensis TaxID=124285 RepID=UPI000347C72B|nr:thiopeptide-type bacteriocin biosynthesis protein [Nocardiopsis xinjiangensis]